MKKNNISILYVEDEENIQKQLSRFIARFCENLYLAKNGAEGLELYKEHKPDIIISDIRMPVMNGIAMIKEIKKLNSKQIIVFISAHSESDYLFEAINMQVDGYILKPVDLSMLEEKLHKLVQQHQNIQAIKELAESEARFRKIANNSQVGIFIYKEKFTYVNEAFCHMTGYSEEELLTMEAWSMVKPEMQAKFKEYTLMRLEGKGFDTEYDNLHLLTKEKKEKIFRVSASTIYVDGGYAGLGMIIDITKLINTQEKLIIYEQAIEQMDEMVRITNIKGDIIFANNALTNHTGYTTIELIGKNNSIFKSNDHDDTFYNRLWNTILAGKVFRDTFINKKKNGDLFYEDQTITPIFNTQHTKIKYFVSTSKDVTERINMVNELQRLATTDTLTGIYNRYKINQVIDEEIARTKRYKEPFALIMFDIDHFKNINDTYGHDVGDIVLQELSNIITTHIRETDTFGRWGGEEFMLIAPKISLEDAFNLANKLRETIANHVFQKVETITVSIGVALFTQESTKETALKEVDDALYLSKTNGRNQVSVIE